MALSRLIRRRIRDACLLVASVSILLAFAAGAAAHTADTSRPVVHMSPAPTLVKETVVQPGGRAPSTITLVLVRIAAAAAALGAGYLGARIALRTSGTPLSGQASRTGI
jgi:hypothetical protein